MVNLPKHFSENNVGRYIYVHDQFKEYFHLSAVI